MRFLKMIVLPLLKGLKLTLKRFLNPFSIITIQYPEKKREVSPRWRGIHYFAKDEKGETKCVACGLCQAVCPSNVITIEAAEEPGGTRYPKRFLINLTRCIFCGFCEEVCPKDAIKLGRNYEFVNYKRSDFILNKEDLLNYDLVKP